MSTARRSLLLPTGEEAGASAPIRMTTSTGSSRSPKQDIQSTSTTLPRRKPMSYGKSWAYRHFRPTRRDEPTMSQKTQPMLTVLVPVYNEAPTVDRLLDRLIRGPYPDKEVIVVDDGSTDATPALLQRWVDQRNIVLFRHARNRGKGAAVRTGL